MRLRTIARVAACALALACGSSETPSDSTDDSDSTEPTESVAFEACSSPLLAGISVDGLQMPMADSNAWIRLNASSRNALTDSVVAAVAGDAESATASAVDAGYTLCEDSDLLGWLPSGAGQAVAVLRVDGAAIQLESPHPVFDSDTLDEALAIFERLEGRVLLTSGTHRCASDEASECSGSSSVCTGASEDYRQSDQAHVVDTAFHALHVALSAAFPADRVVSVHGMSADGASLSNGTTDAVAADSPVATLAAALSSEFAGHEITTCNDYAGANVDERLCGTTNVQGRHLNDVVDACGTSATTASGRFIHLEQSRELRDSPNRVASALQSILSE